MKEQLSFFDKEPKEAEISEGKSIKVEEVKENKEENTLSISFRIVKDNGDVIRVKFIFDLSKDSNQKPKIKKQILKSNNPRAFLNEEIRETVEYIEDKHFNQALKQAYAILEERLKKKKEEQIKNSQSNDQLSLQL